MHEFGTTTIPKRSWLWEPLVTKLAEAMRGRASAFTPETSIALLKGTAGPFMDRLGYLAAAIVRGAFNSQGYGKWAAWKGSYSNKTGQILVDTRELESSVDYKVENK
jgi:phage gpG-like protein